MLLVLVAIGLGATFLPVLIGNYMPKTAAKIDAFLDRRFVESTIRAIRRGDTWIQNDIHTYVARNLPWQLPSPKPRMTLGGTPDEHDEWVLGEEQARVVRIQRLVEAILSQLS